MIEIVRADKRLFLKAVTEDGEKIASLAEMRAEIKKAERASQGDYMQ